MPFLFLFAKYRKETAEMKRQSKEARFQSGLIRELKQRFPDCMVMKLDSNYIQGIPDLLVLWGRQWATLECKRSEHAHKQPNQQYYVDRMNAMSFSRIIFPENKEEVLNELEQAFRTDGNARSPVGE